MKINDNEIQGILTRTPESEQCEIQNKFFNYCIEQGFTRPEKMYAMMNNYVDYIDQQKKDEGKGIYKKDKKYYIHHAEHNYELKFREKISKFSLVEIPEELRNTMKSCQVENCFSNARYEIVTVPWRSNHFIWMTCGDHNKELGEYRNAKRSLCYYSEE